MATETLSQSVTNHGQTRALAERIFPQGLIVDGGRTLQVGNLSGAPGQSLKVQLEGQFAGTWRDFATGESGDLVSLYAQSLGLDVTTDGAEVRARLEQDGFLPRRRNRKSKPERAAGSWNWQYHFANGQLAFEAYLRRQDSGKVTRGYRYRGNDGQWVYRLPNLGQSEAGKGPRPLYRLSQLTESESAIVVVVEGEKTADSAARLFPAPEFAVTTSAGGCNGDSKSDWQPLRGRRVIVCPDNDSQGLGYGHRVTRWARLHGAESVKWLTHIGARRLWGVAESEQFSGWDLADLPESAAPVPDAFWNSDYLRNPPRQDDSKAAKSKASAEEKIRRDHVRRAVVRQSLEKEPVATLPGQQLFRKNGHGWEAQEDHDVVADIGLDLESAFEKQDFDWLVESSDYPDILARVRRETRPIAVRKGRIQAEDTARPFCMQSGKLLDGAAFANGRVVVDSDGNGELTLVEICDNRDSWVPRSLVESIHKHLKLGAGGEDIRSMPGATLMDVDPNAMPADVLSTR